MTATAARTLSEVLPKSFTALARGGIAASQATLSPALRQLHQHLLRAFLEAGTPPHTAQLREFAMGLGLDTTEAMKALAVADLVHTDSADGSIIVAYPLSGRSTSHTVHLEGLAPIHAMCAIDALGIPLMAGKDGVITSSDVTIRQPIRVELKAGTWSWQPSSAVLVLGASGSCKGPIATACPLANFHISAEQATAYLAARPEVTGRVLTQDEAIEIARNEFGPLLGRQR